MGRLINLFDDDVLIVNGVDTVKGISEYTISRGRGSIGADFSITLPKIETLVEAGDEVEFKDIEGIVTSKEIRASGNGFITVINGVSKIGELIRRAPIKTLTYMSLTPAEKEEFDIACDGDYSELDYIPLIKLCDPQTFTGGWTSNEIIEDLLVNRGGFEVVCNVYNYWVRQVQASNTSSYFDTVLSIVYFLRPIIYEQDGIIFILERPVVNGTITLNKFSNVVQRYVYSSESKAKYFRVTGGYGMWRRDKSKVPAEPEKETTLVSEAYQESPMYGKLVLRGEKEVIDKTTGSRSYSWGGFGEEEKAPEVVAEFTYPLKEPMRERYTTTEVWRLDPYGNFKALLSRRKVGYNLTLDAKVLDELELYEYDFLSEEYERPRLRSRRTVTAKYTWVISELTGLVTSRQYNERASETSEAWVYSDNGTLLQETKTTMMDCVRLVAGDEYVAVDVADKYFREEGSEDYATVERMVVEEVVTNYRQISPDVFEKSTTIRKLGPLSRKIGQENYVTTSTMVRGRVQRSPMVYRKMIVEVDNIPDDSDETIDVPVMSISNPNIIDWDDAEAIFNRLKQQALESNYVERVITVPWDIPVDIGWAISLPGIDVGKKLEKPSAGAPYEEDFQTIPEVVIPNYSLITGYEKRKRAGEPSIETVITVEAR